MINEDENEKKRHIQIKIFDLVTYDFKPTIFNDFVYQNQFFI